MTPFEIVKNIFNKDKYLTDDELLGYSQWMVNKILSCDEYCIYVVREINYTMTDRMHYDFLYYGLPKMLKKYIPYNLKKVMVEKEIKYIMDFYGVDQNRAGMYHSMIPKEELTSIKDYFEKRGVVTK